MPPVKKSVWALQELGVAALPMQSSAVSADIQACDQLFSPTSIGINMYDA